MLILGIPERSVTDARAQLAIAIFIDSLESRIPDQGTNYHLIARSDDSRGSKIIYMTSVVSLSIFWNNVPDFFTRNGNRIVFWFDSKDDESASDIFMSFHRQFRNQLINDIDEFGNIDPAMDLEAGLHRSLGTLRFEWKNDSELKVSRSCTFPDKKFYSAGKKFDSGGNLLVDDGVYDLCSVDKPFHFAAEGFDPVAYIEDTGRLPIAFIRQHRVKVFITIGPDGKVVKVTFNEAGNLLDDSLKAKTEDVIRSLPPLNIATVKGRPVKYRLSLIL